jgi:site-specific DNA recombinase
MKNSYIAYLRVSTTKQGSTGVSLSEQRLAIAHYAQSRQLNIDRWYTETQSAACGGRPMFTKALQDLNSGRFAGLIIHKIDRGARNLADWARLGELIDRGINIHFAHDDLDLQSRGGRLAADIQAVIAADFVRNLREEARKGMRGRFRQGLYPLPTPLGYRNNGRGQPKTLDPVRAPLVRLAFELYASGQHTLRSVQLAVHGRGLRNFLDHPVSINGLSRILKNPFYAGLLRLRRTGDQFVGVHEPLVSYSQFLQVQEQLRRRKHKARITQHAFRFRRKLKCERCERTLTGEIQKGHVYYRSEGSPQNGLVIRA